MFTMKKTQASSILSHRLFFGASTSYAPQFKVTPWGRQERVTFTSKGF